MSSRRLCADVGSKEPWLLQLVRIFEVFDHKTVQSVVPSHSIQVLVPMYLVIISSSSFIC
jgi:hypothetical protein